MAKKNETTSSDTAPASPKPSAKVDGKAATVLIDYCGVPAMSAKCEIESLCSQSAAAADAVNGAKGVAEARRTLRRATPKMRREGKTHAGHVLARANVRAEAGDAAPVEMLDGKDIAPLVLSADVVLHAGLNRLDAKAWAKVEAKVAKHAKGSAAVFEPKRRDLAGLVDLIGRTWSVSGLSVLAELEDGWYPRNRRDAVSDALKRQLARVIARMPEQMVASF